LNIQRAVVVEVEGDKGGDAGSSGFAEGAGVVKLRTRAVNRDGGLVVEERTGAMVMPAPLFKVSPPVPVNRIVPPFSSARVVK